MYYRPEGDVSYCCPFGTKYVYREELPTEKNPDARTSCPFLTSSPVPVDSMDPG